MRASGGKKTSKKTDIIHPWVAGEPLAALKKQAAGCIEFFAGWMMRLGNQRRPFWFFNHATWKSSL
jgi:hypothetical protein